MAKESMSSQRERKVRFHGRVQFKTIRHVADFAEEEIVEGWYRKKDFMRMSEEVSEIAQLVAQGKERHNGEDLCIRGLEHLVEEDVADYRAEKMIASIDAVLDEQDEQRDENVIDVETMAKLYTEIVTPLLREAYLVGLRDAKEAAAAAESIPDLAMEEVSKDAPLSPSTSMPEIPESKTTTVTKKAAKTPSVGLKSLYAGSTALLNDFEEEKANKASDGVPKPKVDNDSPRKVTPRKNRTGGRATEMSPFVRRSDGTLAFRNKDLDSAKAELKKQRKDCVRDSLFKYLDSPDPSIPSR
jgi:hypothetical protein